MYPNPARIIAVSRIRNHLEPKNIPVKLQGCRHIENGNKRSHSAHVNRHKILPGRYRKILYWHGLSGLGAFPAFREKSVIAGMHVANLRFYSQIERVSNAFAVALRLPGRCISGMHVWQWFWPLQPDSQDSVCESPSQTARYTVC